MFWPRPTWRAISLAMAIWSPVTIFTFTPISGGRDGALRIFPGRVEQRQNAQETPLAAIIGACHTQGAKAARSEFLHGFVDRLSIFAGIGS